MLLRSPHAVRQADVGTCLMSTRNGTHSKEGHARGAGQDSHVTAARPDPTHERGKRACSMCRVICGPYGRCARTAAGDWAHRGRMDGWMDRTAL